TDAEQLDHELPAVFDPDPVRAPPPAGLLEDALGLLGVVPQHRAAVVRVPGNRRRENRGRDGVGAGEHRLLDRLAVPAELDRPAYRDVVGREQLGVEVEVDGGSGDTPVYDL